ncbi:MAG: hypothetical protein ABSD46_04715 [Bacteroidota bacterium]
MKRLSLSIIAGIICAIICAIGRKYLIPSITLSALIVSSFGNRILIGFVIGISRLKMNYLLHGAFIGFLVTLSYSIGMILDNNVMGFIPYTIGGTIFGLFIELFVSKICKAPSV